MLARINRYMEKQIARDTWDDVAWYIGGYMYMTLGKWLDSMFILYSAVPYAFLLLGYNIYLTVLFCRKFYMHGRIFYFLYLQGNRGYLISPQGNHTSELPVGYQFRGMSAHTGGQVAVERCG